MDNLEEMDKFLEKHNIPSLNQESLENINRPITSTEIDTVIKNLSTNKSLGPFPSQAPLYTDSLIRICPVNTSVSA